MFKQCLLYFVHKKPAAIREFVNIHSYFKTKATRSVGKWL